MLTLLIIPLTIIVTYWMPLVMLCCFVGDDLNLSHRAISHGLDLLLVNYISSFLSDKVHLRLCTNVVVFLADETQSFDNGAL